MFYQDEFFVHILMYNCTQMIHQMHILFMETAIWTQPKTGHIEYTSAPYFSIKKIPEIGWFKSWVWLCQYVLVFGLFFPSSLRHHHCGFKFNVHFQCAIHSHTYRFVIAVLFGRFVIGLLNQHSNQYPTYIYLHNKFPANNLCIWPMP